MEENDWEQDLEDDYAGYITGFSREVDLGPTTEPVDGTLGGMCLLILLTFVVLGIAFIALGGGQPY
jgi:hypothetical protein